MPSPSTDPRISVVLPTRDRGALLDAALAALERQTLPKDAFEILIVDDGSGDDTRARIEAWNRRLPIALHRQAPSGASAARNLGIFTSRAPIVLFLDDDEEATPDLLEQHLAGHAASPSSDVAILGHTAWSPELRPTRLMRYVVDIGCTLFSYPHLRPDTPLEFHHFWTGRISVKRTFLVHNGVFSTRLRRLEDVELGFRLFRHGLGIRYRPEARSLMAVPLALDGYLSKVETDGAALVDLRSLHPTEPGIAAYCGLDDAASRWAALEPTHEADLAEALRIDGDLGQDDGDASPAAERLWELYGRLIAGRRARGILRRLASRDAAPAP